MKILLTSSNGGIGSAIKEVLKDHDITEMNHADVDLSEYGDIFMFENQRKGEKFDWLIFAHGLIHEPSVMLTFAVNTTSCIYLTNLFLSHLRPGGGVIFISSTAYQGNKDFPVYAASKAAVNVYAQSMAKKHLSLNFITICPGPTDTPMWRQLGFTGKTQPPSAVAVVVKEAVEGAFDSGAIITVRDSIVSV